MTQILTLTAMILVAAFSRVIPHPWNFTAIAAMALFGGTYLPSKKLSLLIPFGALLLSDLVLGFHNTMVFVYGAFLLIVAMGWVLRDSKTIAKIGGFAVGSSLVFFIISNFGVWFIGGLYTPDFNGLIQCYVAAIPFLKNQILGDLFFSGVLFGAYELLKKSLPQFAVALQK